MKHVFWLLLLAVSFTASAQTVFRIDSLPVKSIIFNKGWVWQAGDNPDWAKPTFDDRKWQPIDPTQDIDRLPQIKKAGIGWFRLRLKVDTSLVNQVVGILVSQVIASEIYLDGQRVASFGKVSRNPNEVEACNPSGSPLAASQIAYFNLGKQTDQVLAVRFAVEPGLVYWGNVNIYTRCLHIRMNKANLMNYGHIESLGNLDLTPLGYFKAGLFLILALLHLTFYRGYRIQKANLYFGIYCLLVAGNFLLEQSTLQYIHSVSARMYVKQVTGVQAFVLDLSLLAAVYALFSYPNKRPFRGLALLGLSLWLLCFFQKELGGLVGTLYGVIILAESARVSVWAIRKKKENARYILFGSLGFAVFLLLFLLEASVLKPGFVRLITINLTYNLGALCLPVSIALYLAREFVQTSVSLQKNLVEVKQLSAEKEQILSSQNETLERQVAERTAELSHKNEELVIEAALERVRSQSMAMQHSDDLQKVITVVSEQLQGLGFEYDFVNFVVVRADRGWDSYNAVPTNDEILSFTIPYLEHKLFSQGEEAIQQEIDFFAYTLTPDEKAQWLTYLFSQTILKDAPADYKQFVIDSPGMAGSVVMSIDLGFSIVNYQGVPYTDTENAIFKRFGLVFGQAYTRFKDLRKAEEQAREAVRTAALDRVRAEIASMRTTQDLERITPLIWTELTTLQVPFFRCGVFIINQAQHHIQAFLSTPDGRSRTQLNLPIDQTENNQQLVQSWQRQQIYHDRWSHQQLQQWAASMVEEGQIDSLQEYEVVEEVQDAFSLQFIPFRQGMLYVGSQQPLTERELDLAQSLADAFSVAYARYADFRQLEEAKMQVDATLKELKATQNQLVQKEKLASLGELTAGIAHEIQNPLNFVNNFSEVSAELVEEQKEALAKGDVEEANFIADDLRQNLEKINHHGGRASASVRGMLEHSRTSTGEKAPTDLNTLADEYLRLAYQGLRAKDKGFNADLKTDFDASLRLVNVVAQDIGRVLLNLYNNAFYAVQQRAKQAESGYQPTVWVSTRPEPGGVMVCVRDNGTGIPESVKAKIFQPFFTTKPTGEGTGLGLSLSYDIVNKGHGGTMTVESREGEGSEFVIGIPL